MASRTEAVKPPQRQLSPAVLPSTATATLSAFPTLGRSVTIHRKPVADSREPAGLATDAPISSTSRRHSWTSPHDLNLGGMLVPKGNADGSTPVTASGADKQMRAVALLPRPGATFEMAYFLKNTGPQPLRELPEKERMSVGKVKKSLSVFKKKREASAAALNTLFVKDRTRENFVPRDIVEQKVTLKGKKYLQIIPVPDGSDGAEGDVVRSSSMSCSPKPYHLPISFSDYNENVNTQVLDSWISAFTAQHNQVDLDLRANSSTPKDPQIIQQESTPKVPRRSYSCRSDLKSGLPGCDSGFGLSFIDDPIVSNSHAGMPKVKAALGSHPPTLPLTPVTSFLNPRSARCAEMDGRGHVIQSTQKCFRAGGNESTHPSQSMDQVSGHEFRSSHQEQDSTLMGVLDGCTEDRVEAMPLVPNSSPISDESVEADKFEHVEQSRKRRETIVQAGKLQDLQRVHPKIQTAANERTPTRLREKDLKEPTTPDNIVRMQFPTPPSSGRRASSQILLNCRIDSAPISGTLRPSPIIVIAEQSPVARGKQTKKPTRLVLRGRRESSPIAIAVRSVDERIKPPVFQPCGTRLSLSPQESISEYPSTAEEANEHKKNKNLTPAESSHTPPTIIIPQRSTPHLHTPSTSTKANLYAPLFPQAVTISATTSTSTKSNTRTSVCSSHTSASKEVRLEARLEALERENKLLEAALMAVLKTGGTLNRCPCGVSGRRGDGSGSGSGSASRSRNGNRSKRRRRQSTLVKSNGSANGDGSGSGIVREMGQEERDTMGGAGEMIVHDDNHVSEDVDVNDEIDNRIDAVGKRRSVRSMDTAYASGRDISALEVYLQTRLGR